MRRKPGPKLKEVCKWGHPMVGDNVRWTQRQGRKERGCVACNRRRNKEKKERRKTIRHEKRAAVVAEAPIPLGVLLYREERERRIREGKRVA